MHLKYPTLLYVCRRLKQITIACNINDVIRFDLIRCKASAGAPLHAKQEVLLPKKKSNKTEKKHL